jgi:hypothetical protein
MVKYIQIHDHNLQMFQVIYVSSCFLTLIRPKTNSFNDNPWESWMIFVVTS